MTSQLDKTFDPAAIEAKWYAHWEAGGLFRPERPDYAKIGCPVLIIAGENDLLRVPGYWRELEAAIPRSTAKVFARSRHSSHIEHAEEFNSLAIDFIRGQAT